MDSGRIPGSVKESASSILTTSDLSRAVGSRVLSSGSTNHTGQLDHVCCLLLSHGFPSSGSHSWLCTLRTFTRFPPFGIILQRPNRTWIIHLKLNELFTKTCGHLSQSSNTEYLTKTPQHNTARFRINNALQRNFQPSPSLSFRFTTLAILHFQRDDLSFHTTTHDHHQQFRSYPKPEYNIDQNLKPHMTSV